MERTYLPRIIRGFLITMAVTLMLSSSALAVTYKTLHIFRGSDGSYPEFTLTFDAAGNLYGATCSGGAYGSGVVFKLAPNGDGTWTESTLYQFTGGTDSCPLGGLVFDSAGNLYGSAYESSSGPGAIFELTPNPDGTWTEIVLHSFTGGVDGAAPSSPLTFDDAGTMYGTLMAGTVNGCGGVFSFTPNPDGSWTESVLHSFTMSDGCHPSGAHLIFDAAGNLYGTTYWGGTGQCVFGCGTVFKLAPNQDGSWTESVLHNFTGGWDGANAAGNLVFDAAGNLYGATDWGDLQQGCERTGCGTVFKLTPNSNGSWTAHILHNFTGGKDGGQGYGGCGLTLDAAGNLYGTRVGGGTYGYGGVYKLTPTSGGGWKETGLAFNDHPAAFPDGGVIFDAPGNLYGTTAGDGGRTFGTVFEITP